MQLEPLPPRETAVDACTRRLRSAIISGELAPGVRLPPERKLAESFGVNRVTVRGALARLSQAGLLRARQGSGHVVQDFRRRGGPELLAGLAELARDGGGLEDLVRDLLHVRRHLARAVLERLAEASSPGRAEVAAAVDRFGAVVESGADVDAIAAADLEVLAAILDATGSPVLGLCLNPVLAVVQGMGELRHAMYAEPRSNVAAYRVLIAWLEDPAPELLDPVFAELERRDESTARRVRRAAPTENER